MTSWKPLSLSKRFSQNGDNCQEWSIRGGLNTACGDKMMNYYSGTKYGASYWLEPFCNLKKNSENLIPRLESTDFKSWHNRHNDGWDEDFPCKFHHHWVTQGGEHRNEQIYGLSSNSRVWVSFGHLWELHQTNKIKYIKQHHGTGQQYINV